MQNWKRRAHTYEHITAYSNNMYAVDECVDDM